MGVMEVWLGAAGSGKTRRALAVLLEEMNRDWKAVRYLVPTVGHKRSIEHLLLQQSPKRGLLGDPVNIFFTFAQEVAARGGVHGRQLSELQKHLILKELVQTTPLDFFQPAAQFPGFVQALGEIVDELKVHMVQAEQLVDAATIAGERGAMHFARKVRELASLYARYQQNVIDQNVYDNEGIMWLAAECLREQGDLYAGELHCLILDGFARLTPIQLHFLQALVPRVERTILLFEHEEARSLTYHPVLVSLAQLEKLEHEAGLVMHLVSFQPSAPARTALERVRLEVFRDRKITCASDESLRLFIGAMPAHEEELVAREVRKLLRAGQLSDGTGVLPADIAILARDSERVRERFARTFQRYGIALKQHPPVLAHTAVGRTLLAACRLVRDHWKREDVLTLLKSGFLPIDLAFAFHIDLIARTHYLREQRESWFDGWPDEATREQLAEALVPLVAFDRAYRRRQPMLDAVSALLQAFRQQAVPAAPPLPDLDPAAARRHAALVYEFAGCDEMLAALRQLHLTALMGLNEQVIDVLTTALSRQTLHDPGVNDEGIAVLSVHATGGQKFKVVFLCDLLQGGFPRHQRESAFLMDNEREETLRDLKVLIETRRHLEGDEQYWFLHALSSATHRVILSYAANDVDGKPQERSIFVDEVEKILPDFTARAKETTFGDIAPPLADAETRGEFYAGLGSQLRTARDPRRHVELVAAYHGSQSATRHDGLLAKAFQRALPLAPELLGPGILAHLTARTRPFTPTELQHYHDCPYLWFASDCLALRPVLEEFTPLDRGEIFHGILEELYRRRQQHPGEPVHLETEDLDALWPEVEESLAHRLEREPRFANRLSFLKDVEMEQMARIMRGFLAGEIERARVQNTHPAFFEYRFGGASPRELLLADGTVSVRGTIDRIDLLDDDPEQALVIDYKSSASVTAKDLRAGRIVQAPVYLLAVQRLLRFAPVGMEFLGLKQGMATGVYLQGKAAGASAGRRSVPFDENAWQAYLDRCERALGDSVRAMASGEIPLRPTMSRCLERCACFSLCRGDRYLLSRQLRAGDASLTGVGAGT